MLTSRVFQFDMIPNQLMSTGERFHSFLDPALSMRCVAPERIAADVAGATNVRSTPLSLTIDASDFSLAITSPLLPLTSNSTIECQLHSTHPLTLLLWKTLSSKTAFWYHWILKFILPIIIPRELRHITMTSQLRLLFKDRSVWIFSKVGTIFGMSEIDTFISSKNHLPNPLPLSFCITHGMSNA